MEYEAVLTQPAVLAMAGVATGEVAAAGVSLNQYIATALAARVGAQAKTERYFAAWAAQATPGRAREILARAGRGNPPMPGDELDDGDQPA